MGGRLDATNISDPDLSLITRIDLDHQEVLGKTLKKIAAEKAGIMRGRRPVFVSTQWAAAMKTLVARARVLKATLILTDSERFLSFEEAALKTILKTRGIHQEQNARLSLSAFRYAAKK